MNRGERDRQFDGDGFKAPSLKSLHSTLSHVPTFPSPGVENHKFRLHRTSPRYKLESFSELTLKEPISRAIGELGYVKPSPIQAEALPILLQGNSDFIGLAATGTGKTAAFSIPMLEKIDPTLKVTQALILCPTRELSLQVAGQVNLLGKYLGIRALPIYGGASYSEQFQGLKNGAPVVVGTPGRLIDHLERGTLDLSQIRVIVLDEADEMISMGFREDMETILEKAPEEGSDTWLFSATMSPAVRKVADHFLEKPKTVQINKKEMLSATVEQLYYMTQERNKPEILCKLVDAAEDFYGVVFCQTKALVTDLTRYLNDRGYKADCLHGDMSQAAREQTMKAFRERRVSIMVCTDVASRGLDVKDITHVVNYSIPRELDNYVHRIGRTARSGKNGVAMSLVTPSHVGLITRIERMTSSKMKEGKIPTRRDLANKKVAALLEKFVGQESYERAVQILSPEWITTLAPMSGIEIAGRLLALMYPEVFSDKAIEQMTRSTPPPEQQRQDTRRDYRGGGGHDRRSEGGEKKRDYRRPRPRYGKGGGHPGGPRKSVSAGHSSRRSY